jgi:6-phosphofructokinase 1
LKRIGLLTSGGDAPGMNPAIRAVVRSATARDVEVFGFEDGFLGLIEGRGRVLSARDVGDTIHRGGTMLRTARCPQMKTSEGVESALQSLRAAEVEGLIVIGGDGSLTGAHALAERGVAVVGVPASIDHDIWGTRMSIGVDSALNTIMEAIDRLRDTASSHKRTFLVETMGRSSGYLAAMAGVICGAELVVVPEAAMSLDDIEGVVAQAYARGKAHCIVIVAEGASQRVDQIAEHLTERNTGFECRVTKLGHIQRGGTPSAFDRILASRMGVKATHGLLGGWKDVMVSLQGSDLGFTPLTEVVSRPGVPSQEYLDLTRLLAV